MSCSASVGSSINPCACRLLSYNYILAALSTKLFVKIGLVLLGTSVIFGDILKAGPLGLIQALLVVLSVGYFAFWVSKRLKVDDELTPTALCLSDCQTFNIAITLVIAYYLFG